jgi:class 3 adenylate cyclase
MALRDDLEKEVYKILGNGWATRKGTVVPVTRDIRLGGDGIKLDAAVLYSVLADPTSLVADSKEFAAEICKSQLTCAAKINRAEGGTITSMDGGRIMAVYLGGTRCTAAARTALKINYAVQKIIDPQLKAQYPDTEYKVQHIVGVDSGKVLVVRGGTGGSNDLVWVGDAVSRAAKLCSVTPAHPSWITKKVYDAMQDSAKYSDGTALWNVYKWTELDDSPIYASAWFWEP